MEQLQNSLDTHKYKMIAIKSAKFYMDRSTVSYLQTLNMTTG